jgi:hypothetical protein
MEKNAWTTSSVDTKEALKEALSVLTKLFLFYVASEQFSRLCP